MVGVVGADNKVSMKVVKPGSVEGSMWIIDEGLNPGDRVIVGGLQRVRSGMVVVPQEAGSAAPEKAPAAAPEKAGK
jgi:membrane fusion protein (multidrug efflux system)